MVDLLIVTQNNYEADTRELDKNKNNTTPNKPQTETMSTRRHQRCLRQW